MAKINKSTYPIVYNAKEKCYDWNFKFKRSLKNRLPIVNIPLKTIKKRWLKAGYNLETLYKIGTIKAIKILQLKNR